MIDDLSQVRVKQAYLAEGRGVLLCSKGSQFCRRSSSSAIAGARLSFRICGARYSTQVTRPLELEAPGALSRDNPRKMCAIALEAKSYFAFGALVTFGAFAGFTALAGDAGVAGATFPVMPMVRMYLCLTPNAASKRAALLSPAQAWRLQSARKLGFLVDPHPLQRKLQPASAPHRRPPHR